MARYKQQLNNALEGLDQGLAILHSLIKRGQNAEALRFMEEGLKDRYDNLENIINIEPEDNQSKVGFLGTR